MQAHGRQPPILAVSLFLKMLVRCPTVLQADVSLPLNIRSEIEVKRDVDLCLVLFENLRGLHFHIGIIRHLGEILHQEINILLDSPDGSFQCRIVDSVE